MSAANGEYPPLSGSAFPPVLDADKAAIDNIERTVAAAQAATEELPLAEDPKDDDPPF